MSNKWLKNSLYLSFMMILLAMALFADQVITRKLLVAMALILGSMTIQNLSTKTQQ